MFELLNRVYAENETVLSDHTNMAIVLLIMGIGYVNTKSDCCRLPKVDNLLGVYGQLRGGTNRCRLGKESRMTLLSSIPNCGYA
jgi:hypothetical protein